MCMCIREREGYMHVIHIIYYKSLINIFNRFHAALISSILIERHRYEIMDDDSR